MTLVAKRNFKQTTEHHLDKTKTNRKAMMVTKPLELSTKKKSQMNQNIIILK